MDDGWLKPFSIITSREKKKTRLSCRWVICRSRLDVLAKTLGCLQRATNKQTLYLLRFLEGDFLFSQYIDHIERRTDTKSHRDVFDWFVKKRF